MIGSPCTVLSLTKTPSVDVLVPGSNGFFYCLTVQVGMDSDKVDCLIVSVVEPVAGPVLILSMLHFEKKNSCCFVESSSS